jgi:hypothetical protein
MPVTDQASLLSDPEERGKRPAIRGLAPHIARDDLARVLDAVLAQPWLGAPHHGAHVNNVTPQQASVPPSCAFPGAAW